ncbi:MAG TPA: NADH-quinone oxidoreductase subunit NuoK [Nonomuraea sp.]|nr:NADH-quinone oxidoreductase subunit NuoK [Nonomuraea sp.]
MHIVYPAVVSALLFSVGVYGVLARRNTILVLMSVELMLNAVNLNLVAFDVWLGDRLHSGQVLTLFIIVIAAAEVGLGLAIVLALYRNRRTVDIDQLRDLSEPGTPRDPAGSGTLGGPAGPGTSDGSAGSGRSGGSADPGAPDDSAALGASDDPADPSARRLGESAVAGDSAETAETVRRGGML